jgi:hypothetical protein
VINNLLLRMKLSNESPDVRLGALDKIPSSEQETFCEIAGSDSDAGVRREAIRRLDNESMLETLWESEQDPEIKQVIREKLNRRYTVLLAEGKTVAPGPLSRIDDELLLVTALCSTPNPEVAEQLSGLIRSTGGIVKTIRNLDNYQLGLKLFNKLGDDRDLWMDIAETAANPRLKQFVRDKIIADTSKDENIEPVQPGISQTLKEKLHVYEDIIAEVKRLTGYIGADAAERLQGLQDKWHTLPEVSPGFMEVLDLEFKQACRDFKDGVETARREQEERLRRIDHLDAVYAEAIKMVADVSAPLKQEHLTRLRKSWESSAEGMTAIEHLSERFDKACGELEQRVQNFKQLITDSLSRIDEIIAEVDAQLKMEDPDISRERRIELEKEIDALVEKSSANPQVAAQRERFLAMNKSLRQKIHELHQVRDLARWESYALKIVLCEQAEKLLENNDLREVSQIFKGIRQRWREIGMVPHEKLEEINTRFQQSSEELNRRCTEFFNELNRRRDEIATAKDALCSEAESLQGSTAWNKTADRFKEIQKQWRELGYARHEVENALNKRFRAACDVFFNARRIHLDNLQQQRTQATDAKNKLCEEAKNLLETNPAELYRQSRQLWDQWREAGSAGRDDHKLYETFKAIFDSYHDHRRNEREGNLTQKKQICAELKNLLETSRSALTVEAGQKRLQDLQREWDAAGQTPREQEKETIREYEQLTRELQKTFRSQRTARDREVIDLQQKICRIIGAMTAGSTLEAAREELQSLGEIPPELSPLRQIFEQLATGDANSLSTFAANQEKALQEMKEICTHFEQLNGIETRRESNDLSDLLADLNAALQNNIVSAPQDSGNRAHNAQDLRLRWLRAGVPPMSEIDSIFDRYRIATQLA